MSSQNSFQRTSDRAVRRQEGGFVLLMAVFTLLFLAGIIVAGTDGGLARRLAGESSAANPVRAREIATAGLADALSWFPAPETSSP